jgi:thermitase
MKRKIVLLILTGMIQVFCFSRVGGETANNKIDASLYIENRVVIKLIPENESLFMQPFSSRDPGNIVKPIDPAQRLMSKYSRQFKQMHEDPATGYYIIETQTGVDIEALCKNLRKENHVLDASPDYIVTITRTATDDRYFQYQWALINGGQIYNPSSGATGTPGSDIKALDGWDYSIGGDDIIIAIIDTGVALGHEDLVNKIVPGFNIIDSNYDASDDHGHGTFVASLAAAETNNGIGIAGVSWNAKIMPIKVIGSDGNGSSYAAALGIRWAVEHGAQIINLSLGSPIPNFLIEDACKYAYDNGAVIVASTGNTGSTVLYPAAYDDYCIAVGATDPNDQRPSWSNFGPSVDVVAPGQSVVGAYFDPNDPQTLNAYAWGEGTSFAAPHVAGAAALLMSYKPFLTNQEIMTLIKITADDINAAEYPGIDELIGYGRINLKTLLGPYLLGE